MNERKLKVGSLFSGIGGIELGLERTKGFRTVWFSEVDEFANSVLAARWKSVPNHGDIREIDWNTVEPIDVLTGGFPCQDISIAGKKKGIEGERSSLWKEYHRAIRHLRPRFIIVENVDRLLSAGIWIVLQDLAKEGYNAEWEVLQASDFGAPHKRARCFIIAYPCTKRWSASGLFNTENAFSFDKEFDVAKNITSGFNWQCWLNALCETKYGTVSKTDFCGVDDGLPEGMDRIRALGNAVVPQCAEYIGRRIIGE